jgi:hypothetical protein
MGSASEGCRENNTIMAKAAANSRNINRRGRERTPSRPSYIGIDWTSYDEDIKNNKNESTTQGREEGGKPNRKAVSGSGSR